MSWQKIELNMIPDTKVLPVVHASQFDSNRSISFQMFTGEDEWTIPEGLTIELHCRKVDDNIVTLAPFSVVGSVITFITTEQLTACSGQNKCELSFIDSDDLIIGSLNFILDVEPDPLKGGITSASSIYDLTQQIEDIAQEVIGDDYYNKTEVDTLLADKADISDLPDMSLYYTKTATDSLLNAKANTADLAAVATSGDYDDLINKPVLPDMTQYYTKSEVDTLLDNQFPTFTASGNVATFTTALNKPLVSVTADAAATTITRCSVNLWNEEMELGTLSWADGTPIPYNTRMRFVNFVPVNENTNYKIICPSDYDIIVYDINKDHLASYYNSGNVVFTVPTGGAYIKITTQASYGTTYNHDMGLMFPSSLSAYEAYNGQTVPVADATTLVTLSGENNVYADAGSVTVQYKYMSI